MSADRSLSRREFARTAAALAAAPLAGRLAVAAVAEPLEAMTRPRPPIWPGYARAIVIDALGSPGPFNVPDMTAAPLSDAMVANAAASGITAINVTLVGSGNGSAAFEGIVHSIGYWERELDAHPERFLKVKTVGDLRRAKESGKLGLIYGFQDGTMLGDDTSRVDLFHRLGVRIIQPTYNRRNLIGDGCLEEANAGLSAFGRGVVARMNELGVLLDLSHCGQRTTLDGITVSTKPVAVTHSGCAALNPVPRNKPDATMKELADRGGVMGIYLMPFLRPSGQPTDDDLVRHIDHAVRICGEDHVGIGSDLSITPLDLTPEFRAMHAGFVAARNRAGISAPGEAADVFNYVPQLNSPRRLELIADRLASRGYPSARIEKIIGANWLRLFGEVWGS